MYITSSYDDPQVIPPSIRERYEWIEIGNAASILKTVSPSEFQDLLKVLDDFKLTPNEWLVKGGNKGDIAENLDGRFRVLGWKETRIDTEIVGYFFTDFGKKGIEPKKEKISSVYSEGFKVDNHKGRMIVDIEWNAKDGNLDRDLAAYRSWYEYGLIDGAVIITKDRLALLNLAREIWSQYQETVPEHLRKAKLPIDLKTSTVTSLDKADIRVKRGGAGNCPVLIVGVTDKTWDGTPFTLPPEDPATHAEEELVLDNGTED
ncbi:BglII/BstYI family type II restriction endonuclease [Arthrobacter koreensis]|uniref:BglII/BstYI family type II restriction endonuclease n=1 Tax=Arthrobacter koreensis TaxID=199136 RepID=UPI002DBA04D2|nr:BglII/BstYI family type II restriction endonuclease [Arthrobacter koreensis]MEB7448174.1 hypothetical protein [Arthrobacter koreensis]